MSTSIDMSPDITRLKSELATVRSKMLAYLEELGV